MNATSACPTEAALSQAFVEGAPASLGEHLASCPRCKQAWTGFARLRDLGHDVGPDALPAPRRETLRAEVLARAAQPAPARGRSRWLFAGLTAALAAAAVLWLSVGREREGRSGAAAGLRRASVQAQSGARFLASSTQPDEVIRLSEGVLEVDVAALRVGERVRVITGDAEVEVRGTRFEVVAAGDVLTEVRVRHGRVEVRPLGRALVVLADGEHWSSREVASVREFEAPAALPAAATPEPSGATPAVASAPEVAALPAPTTRPTRPGPVTRGTPEAANPAETAQVPEPRAQPAPAVVVSAAELAFNRGWSALRDGDPETAQEAFSRALAAAPSGPLAEDAAYWHAVALARAGHKPEATRALRSFVQRHPGSSRRGSAATMLGWLELDSARLEAAEALFRSAQDDPGAEVASSARAGLAEIARRRRAAR